MFFNNIKTRLNLRLEKTPSFALIYNRYINLYGSYYPICLPSSSKDVIWKDGKFYDEKGFEKKMDKEFLNKFPAYLSFKGVLHNNKFIVYDLPGPYNESYDKRYKTLESYFRPERKRNMPIKLKGNHIELAYTKEIPAIEAKWDIINDMYRKYGKVYIIGKTNKEGLVNRYIAF